MPSDEIDTNSIEFKKLFLGSIWRPPVIQLGVKLEFLAADATAEELVASLNL